MSKQKTDDLMQLVSSLTKAEKRHFRLFAKRNQASEQLLFLQVFDVLDKKGDYDEAFLLRKIPGLKRGQLPNVKAHLMRQLLTSLRMLAIKRNEDIQIRESVDFARVLYDKGLYRSALDLLDKAKERALISQNNALGLEILEFEKLIEGQYITRSLEGRAEDLASQTLRLNQQISRTNRFSNLSLQMYGLYLRKGFVTSGKDYEMVCRYFEDHCPDIDFADLDFLGKVYYCQSHVWLYYIGQEFLSCFRYAQTWVNLFIDEPQMKSLFAPFYLKGLHNLLFSLFRIQHHDRFLQALDLLERFQEEVDYSQNTNIESLYQLYRYMHLINKHYLEGTFAEGTAIVPGLEACINNEGYNWDDHRIMVLNYRIACLYFGAADYDHTIEYLNKITNEKTVNYRSDIQCFARILSLLAHFELGNSELVEYQVKSVYRFLLHVEELQPVQREIFQFLRKTTTFPKSNLLEEFRQLHTKLLPLEGMKYERRPFLYLDIISWLEAKTEGCSIQEVIRRNFLDRAKSKG